MKNILLILFFCFSVFSFAQQSKTDSLLALLKTDQQDTTRINTLNALGRELMYNNPDTAIILGNQALALCEQLFSINNQESTINNLKSSTLGNLGVYYRLKADYPQALDYFLRALKIAEELGNKNHIAAWLGNIGNVNFNQADYPKALDYYLRALKIGEELGDKNKIAIQLGNIGLVYSDQTDYPKALDYFLRALKIAEELGNKNGITFTLGNIGNVYNYQADYPKALDYFLRALKIAEELGNKNTIAITLGNIGNVYHYQADYPKALDYYLRALKIDEELGNKNQIATRLVNIGSLYTKTGKFAEAEEHLKQAIAIDSAIGAQNYLRQSEELLSNLYDTLGQLAARGKNPQGFKNLEGLGNFYKLSLIHYKKAMVLKDTIFSEENKKQMIRKEMNFAFEKKEAAAQAEQEKQAAVAAAESKRQRLFLYLVAAVAAAVAVIAIIIFRSLRITRKQRRELSIKNQKIETAYTLIGEQKKHIEEKQKEIIDSITYAKRLQQAILPPVELLRKHLPNGFVLYNPKDIVAGDFYWMEVIDDIICIAAADCTGHGVPGAMVSVVCSNALNRTVKEFALRDTGKILDKVTDLVLETFEKSGEQIKDGMDISFLSYNKTSKQIQWSGANNPLWYIQNGQLIEIKADKQPIGKFDIRKPFTTHTIAYSENTTFYLFTDGLPDQFGGPKGKKFMYKRFETNLSDICKLPMDEQQTILEKAFQEWKGTLEQVDDVTVIGIRI